MEDILNLGDSVDVKCIDIDPDGKIRLSRRALLPGGESDQRPRNDSNRRHSRPPSKPRR